jgi:6,7-dimethyl-8-ribityllumazine synthase
LGEIRLINRKVLIIISKYYKDISENLLKSAVTFLEENSILFDVVEVPGALEIPHVLNFKVNISNNVKFAYDGYIALGCVIKGETYHFEIVSNETNRGLMNIALKHSFPLGNGIITAYNHHQALQRSLEKGKEAAQACYELIKIKN